MSRTLGPCRLCVKVFEGNLFSSRSSCCSYHGTCKKGTAFLRHIRSPHVWRAIHISPSNCHLVPVSSVSVIKSQRLWERQYILRNSRVALSIPSPLSTLSTRQNFKINSLLWPSLTREFHSSSSVRKEETKIEQTVKALKEQVAEQSKPATSSTPPPAEVDSSSAPSKSIGQRIVAEVKHYYHGFRLLFIDVRICSRLLFQLLRGTTLLRRERRQLVRTTADLFRIVPFLVFIVVPFMEFLLPVAVKLFPSMLPSTFKEENKEHEKVKRSLKVKLEMAKFLQDTIEESALQRQKKFKEGENSMVADFSNFLNKIRTSGTQASTDEIVKFSKLFEDEMTLDNLSRPQLQALCKVLEVPTIGTDTFLQFQLRMKLRQLKADDKMIEKEGVESLTIWELQSACRARGMRALGVPEDRLKSQLQQWLDLHLAEEIPPSLLLLSRALYLPETLSTADQLQATLSSLPETTAEKAKLKVAELTGDKVDNKAKLELIRLEEQAILKEKQDHAMEEEAEATTQAVREDAEAIAAKTAMDMKAELQDTAPIIDAEATEKLVDKAEEVDKIGAQELIEIEAALEEIAEQKKLSIEQEELKELKEDVEEYKEDVEDLKEVILRGGGDVELGESKATQRLVKRVDKMIGQLDDIIGELHEEREEIQEQIEVKEVKVKRSSGEKRDKILEEIQSKKDNIITINDMVLALKHYQKLPDETRLQQIVEVLDDDKDGQINVDHVLKVLELLGKENIKLNTAQVSEVIELIKQETKIERDEKVKKIKEEEFSKQDASKSDNQETVEKDKQQDMQ